MKSKAVFSVVFLAIVLLIGCGKATPEAVAEAYLKALSKNDYEKAMSYCTDEGKALFKTALAMAQGSSLFSQAKNFSYKNLVCEVDDQAGKAKCTCDKKADGQESIMVIDLVKVDGKWKVSPSKGK